MEPLPLKYWGSCGSVHDDKLWGKIKLSLKYNDEISLMLYQSIISGESRCTVSVSEHMGWVRNVVLMSVYLGLENPRGSGFRVGGQMGR